MTKIKLVLNMDTTASGFNLEITQKWCEIIGKEVYLYLSEVKGNMITVFNQSPIGFNKEDVNGKRHLTTEKPIEFGEASALYFTDDDELGEFLKTYNACSFDINEMRYDPRFIELIESLDETTHPLIIVELDYDINPENFPTVIELPIADVEIVLSKKEVDCINALNPHEYAEVMFKKFIEYSMMMGS